MGSSVSWLFFRADEARTVAHKPDFTFALEQDKTYSIGKHAKCDIVVADKRIRNKAGEIVVGDWNPLYVRPSFLLRTLRS
jgi:hypothetical protein